MGMNEFEAGVVARIKESMKTRGLTQEELAKSIGVKQYTVSRMLRGSPFPTAEQLALIANALDVSLYYLIGIQEESYRELSPETRKVADAYQFADPMVKEIIKRLLVIK